MGQRTELRGQEQVTVVGDLVINGYIRTFSPSPKCSARHTCGPVLAHGQAIGDPW